MIDKISVKFLASVIILIMREWHKKSGKAYLTYGVGYGKTELAAFDAAELDAGIMATNAIRVTSFVPPNWEIISDKDAIKKLTGQGRFLPMAYAFAASKNEVVSAALAIAVNKNNNEASIITEHAEKGIGKGACLATTVECVQETFKFRNWEYAKIEKAATEAAPRDGLYACALVAVLFFPEG